MNTILQYFCAILAPPENRPPVPGNDLEPEVVVPMTNENGEPLTGDEKVEKLVQDLKKAYKKNQALAKANKSLRYLTELRCSYFKNMLL